jgi:transposase-like protein
LSLDVSKNAVMPQAGVDYPATWQAFEKWFADDEACRLFLAGVRWPNGFVCPSCGAGDAWVTARGLWMCRACAVQTSVTAGTIFHRSRLPLRTWFAAIWFVCAQKDGVSALGLQRVLGLGSYSTAWTWMHKLRRAMVRPERDRIGGPGVSVEMDCTFIGGRTSRKSRPRYENKAEVAVAIELLHPKGYGRVRLAHIDSATRKDHLVEFIEENILPGTILYTDGEVAYRTLPARLGITHEPIVLIRSTSPAHETLPGVHRVASLLKRWLTGTLHDGQSAAQLDYYLDEFTFRFNRRPSRSRGLLWYRLIQQSVNTDPHPYQDLIARWVTT